MSRHIQITFDAHDPRALSSFSRDALGYVHPALQESTCPRTPTRWPPGTTSSPGSAYRLVTLGATRLCRYEPAPPMSAGFIVTADPEGNEFRLD